MSSKDLFKGLKGLLEGLFKGLLKTFEKAFERTLKARLKALRPNLKTPAAGNKQETGLERRLGRTF